MMWGDGQRISTGGMSEVYRVTTPEGQRVALKLLTSGDPEVRRLFEEQARLLLRLRHPSLALVLGFLKRSDDIFGIDRGPCFWMEWIEARDVLSAARGAKSEQVLAWFREALDALDCLHGQGVVHGDLSPSNLVIDAGLHLKILDLSALPDEPAVSGMGTLPYTAPERISGHASVGSDLFALGTVFYEALAGRHPRAGCRTFSELIRKEPAPLSSVDPVVGRVIDRMIVADAGKRFTSVAAIKTALDGITDEDAFSGSDRDFYPLALIGADEAQALVHDSLNEAARRSLVLAVHGPSGTGKTRLIREAAFEASVRGLRWESYGDLHRADVEERGRVLAALRALPTTGTLLVLEWSDDLAAEDVRRFLEAVLSEPQARSVVLKNLNRSESESLLEGFLESESWDAFLKEAFTAAEGNPKTLLALLRKIALAGKLRNRALLPGWKDVLDTREPEDREPEDPDERSRYLRQSINRLNGQGRFEEALKVAERWKDLESDEEPRFLKTVKYWWITGWGCHNLGRADEAERRLRRCLQEGRDFRENAEIASLLARSHSLLGLSSLKRDDLKEAQSHFEAALALQPPGDSARGETLRNLARAAEAGGDAFQAQVLLDQAKDVYKKSGRDEGLFWTLLQEGNLKLNGGLFEQAAAAYETAEGLAKSSGSDLRMAIAWNNRGLLERERRRYAQALELLYKARDILRFLGNANDVAHNLKELAVAEACVGRWKKAEIFLRELDGLRVSGFSEAAGMAQAAGASVENIRRGRTDETKDSLQTLFDALPPELQISFVDRGDWRRFFSNTQENEVSMKASPRLQDVLLSLTRLNEVLLVAEEIPGVLERLMEAAMNLAGAENGFLVLRSDSSDGPLPGFEVAIARNLDTKDLQTDLYTFSLSAVRRALQTGETVVTDNALLDPEFREARSVHLRQLKSIVALPVKGKDGILGVFYLDHRFEEGLFEGGLLTSLQAFASVAALALQKGRMIEELSAHNRDLLAQVRAQTRELGRSRLILKNEYSDIVGRSPKMVEVLSLVDRITDAKVPVWIFGESGTGKEAVARSLHFNSPRAKKPFVTENCGALPESLLESELFGHKKGAFTHATSDKKGILQYADGGTIFLDEIADMSVPLQAKLLRFLQEGDVRPVGSNEVVRVDVRVVSASNKDLLSMVREGRFREDLFYRLNGVTVTLPPLRERMEDLPLLVEHFLKKHDMKLETEALRVFLNYPWPGNIRELQNTLETAVLFAEKGAISIRSLQFKPMLFTSIPQPASPALAARPAGLPAQSILAVDPVMIETLRAIRDNAYHKGYAAEALGITRRALYARLQRFGLAMDVKSLKEKIESLAIG